MAKSRADQKAAKERRAALAREVASMAKTANERLRELERKGLTNASNAYKYVERLHYDKDNATATDSSGRMKFNTNFRGKTYQEIQHEAGELSRFLGAQTSKKSGVDAKYYNQYLSFKSNELWKDKVTLSYPEFAEMMRSNTMKKLKKEYGSDVIVRMSERLSKGEKWKDVEEALDGMEFDKTMWVDVESALDMPKEWRESAPITEGGNIT